MTTTRPPRSPIARKRSRIPGAVMMLPLLTSGFAPIIKKKSVRSTSGTGRSIGWPNICVAATWWGNWSTLVALKRLRVRSNRRKPLELSSEPLLCTVGLPRYVAIESPPKSIFDVAQTRGDVIEGFIPSDRLKSVADAAMRHTQAIRIGMQIDQCGCLRADRTARKWIVRVAAQIGDRPIRNRDLQAADCLAQVAGPKVHSIARRTHRTCLR